MSKRNKPDEVPISREEWQSYADKMAETYREQYPHLSLSQGTASKDNSTHPAGDAQKHFDKDTAARQRVDAWLRSVRKAGYSSEAVEEARELARASFAGNEELLRWCEEVFEDPQGWVMRRRDTMGEKENDGAP